MQSDAVQWREESWVRVELSSVGGGGRGGGGGQTLFITVGVHSETAVAAAPVVAVGGKTVRKTRNCQHARSLFPGELMNEKTDTNTETEIATSALMFVPR